MQLIPIEINEYVKSDVQSVLNGIQKMNAPYAVGYTFTIHQNCHIVHTGTYVSRLELIKEKYLLDYYYDFAEDQYYQVIQ